MASSNRTQLALVRETTLGTTPVTPRMRAMRITGESLAFAPEYVDSDEIRADRMLGDPIKVMQSSNGGVNFELSYPVDNSPLSELLRSACFSAWVNTAQRDNDGTADSVITDIGTTTDTVACVTGTAFVAGQLVRFSGNTASANDGVRKCTTGSATAPVFASSSFSADAAPAATSRMKVVGFQGAAADITALADGLGSTLLDFTTLGIMPGQWIKVGGTLDASTFAFLVTAGTTARANAWMRVTAVAAAKLTCDNLPSGWTTDSGTGKSIKVFFGDYIRNGVTTSSVSIERGFLGQAVPTYIVNTGMVVNTLDLTIASKAKITGAVAFMGMGGSQSTTTLDASPDAATTGQVMAANANVGRLSEAGSQLTSPNWATTFSLQINNNNRALDSVDQSSPVDVQPGECTVTAKIETYFGDNALLAKFYNGTVTSINCRVAKNSQALVFQLPRVTLRGGGNPQAGGKNQDVKASFDATASADTSLLNCSISIDRVEYFET